jgi:hypothetical protein
MIYTVTWLHDPKLGTPNLFPDSYVWKKKKPCIVQINLHAATQKAALKQVSNAYPTTAQPKLRTFSAELNLTKRAENRDLGVPWIIQSIRAKQTTDYCVDSYFQRTGKYRYQLSELTSAEAKDLAADLMDCIEELASALDLAKRHSNKSLRKHGFPQIT